MDHNLYKEQLSALLDGELNETERAAALAHLAECEECRAYFAELTAMHDALTDLDEAEPPADFAAGVLARLHEEAAPQKTKKSSSPWRSWAALAACAAVIVLAVSALPGKGMKSSAPSSAEYAVSAPSAPAPTETTSTPADYYGFTGEANDGYGAADDAQSGMEAIPGTSQMTEPHGEGSAWETMDASGYSGMTGSMKYYLYSPGESETAAPEPPAEDTAPPPVGEAAPEPSGGNPAPEPSGDDPPGEWWEETVPMFSPPTEPAPEPEETLTLVGDGAAEWLAEHAEPLGDGLWRVSVEAVNELPDTLELVGLQEPVDGMLTILFGTPENPQ